ncbi:DUF3150 domain-containing protein [Hydrogenovibrio marinus]|uniref:DUF3150 domain-containing protein n=1 Tax=Hydrogenovibrio marinus TaxID=28885 RepID=A0A066ZWC1_HYDMR|nr:DUF3150 domain-containing protein [Hydrogenovibrio marinus]KDN94636.1 hypothetical protein EI16_12100 [Hydrogenovibrio marinus]
MTIQNHFFEIRLSLFAGTVDRKAFDKATLKSMGFNESDIAEVKAVLNTTVLPRGTFNTPLAIKKAVQDYLATKGHNHPLVGRIFNPKDRVEIVEFLREKKAEYEAWASDFLARYESLKQEQLDKVHTSAEMKGYDSADFIDAVKKAQPHRKYYERKLSFEFLDLSIELDTEQWHDVIDKINSDLVEKTVYELGRDAAGVRDTETPRGRANKLLDLVAKLESLDFYVKGMASLANHIKDRVEDTCGGVKPSKEYSQRENLALNGLAKVLEDNAEGLVKGNTVFADVFGAEARRIEMLLQEDEQQAEVEEIPSEPQRPELKVVEQPEEPVKPEVEQPEQVAKPVQSTPVKVAVGSYAF